MRSANLFPTFVSSCLRVRLFRVRSPWCGAWRDGLAFAKPPRRYSTNKSGSKTAVAEILVPNLRGRFGHLEIRQMAQFAGGKVDESRAPGLFEQRLNSLPISLALAFSWLAQAATNLPPINLGVREEHVFIPMRDGTRLSAYLYYPNSPGPWPVIFEQRYAVITNTSSRQELAGLAQHGYLAARVSFRGAQLSEGVWQGYRALAWGESRDGYDLCEWFGTQPWSIGKVGTFGGSQGGFAQNFLAVTQPPHLVCQYMTDTGLSLFHEGYRIGGITRPERF